MGQKKGNGMIPADAAFPVFNVESRWVFSKERRLDASFYTKDIMTAQILMKKLEEKGVEIKRVEDLSDEVFWPGRFKRKYVKEKQGHPFLIPSEIFMFLPKARKFIRDYPDNLQVKKNWLLITRSGSLGRCLIATSVLTRFVLSDDLIRITPKDENDLNYVSIYLNTWIGQALLTKNRYGATVKHIEPYHVSNILIPYIPELVKEINQRVQKVQSLREEAQADLIKAEELLFSELELPKIDEDDIEYFGGEIGKTIMSFVVKASELNQRFDASYHLPILELIQQILRKENSKYECVTIEDVARPFDLPTYKRIYVKPYEGLPIVSGANLKQMRLLDLKYISPLSFHRRRRSYLDKYRVKEGWILVTERGTTGISTYVSKRWNDWLASHNILRVIPQRILGGFLLIFLNCEYAQHQLKSKELGAVVEVLDPADLGDVLIPISKDKKVEKDIHNLVIKAYNNRDKAIQIEDKAIEKLTYELEDRAEWGKDAQTK